MDALAYKEMVELEDQHWWFVGRRAIIDALLRRLFLPPNARILEIGCGSGGNLSLLSKYGMVYAAEYDSASRAIAESKKIAQSIVHCALPEEFPFYDQKFDLIVMLDVLEHIRDDQASLDLAQSHLNNGGWFLITVPAFPFLWSAHDVKTHHFRRYTKRTLTERLRRAGLTIHYVGFFNTVLFPAIATLRLIKNKAYGKQVAPSDLAIPPGPINAFLAWVFSSERYTIGRVALPFGLSLIAAAQASTNGAAEELSLPNHRAHALCEPKPGSNPTPPERRATTGGELLIHALEGQRDR